MICRVLENKVCTMTQPYHINGSKGYNYDHWGVDLTGFNGSYNVLDWVVAHTEGTVVSYRADCTGYEDNSYGNYVLLAHKNGVYTMYAHLAYGTVQVKTGDHVKTGQRLGYMGNTGTSFGGHLHFEIRDSKQYKFDPEPWLNKEFYSSMEWIKKEVWFLYDNGKMLTGWQKVKDKWYYMDSNGVMHTGWLWDKKYNGWFLLASSGEMLTGWQKTNGKWYYLATETKGDDIKGKMKTGWLKDNGKWYYLDPKDGYMYTGTHVIDGKTYKFADNGALIQ